MRLPPDITNGAGTEQDVQAFSGGQSLGYVDTAAWTSGQSMNMATNSQLSLYFPINTQVSLANSNGAFFQSAIWTIPSSLPGNLGVTFHNSDGTTTVDPPVMTDYLFAEFSILPTSTLPPDN
ncbi:hypothetical protein M231_00367 [Tremella mesenterica]|uniref:Uncharacterized protein n=1 Tax=Tremella mesenterica TaxID=5217 RepID=A0A4V1M524_TREME|nr:hypothetical protein M231_00367 [Tremella mesenterica]